MITGVWVDAGVAINISKGIVVDIKAKGQQYRVWLKNTIYESSTCNFFVKCEFASSFIQMQSTCNIVKA